MKKYRLVLLLDSNLKKDAVNKVVDDAKKWFGQVKNDKVTEIGERKLAYPIKRQRQGNYLALEFDADTIATDTERRIQIQDGVLRHLLVRMD